MILAGRKKKRTFTIGMKVMIRVVSVDLDQRRVEFALLDGPEDSTKPPRKG
jgi:sRNA-binding carbon storage regulator CsrA